MNLNQNWWLILKTYQTKPKWPAGTAVGYHALTFGWLLDQIVRRTDPLKRGIAQFYHEEIQKYMDGLFFPLTMSN